MSEKEKIKVLFLCTANAARSQMAAGIVKKDFGDRVETYSAGTNPKGVSCLAIAVLDEIGVDIRGETSDHLDKYEDIIAQNVTENIYERHIRPLFLK